MQTAHVIQPAEISLAPSSGDQWYAVHVKSRHEFTVSEQLKQSGIYHFLPVVEKRMQWQDRKKMVSFPLFPGYLFVKISNAPDAILKVLRTRGVVKLLGYSPLRPAAIPEKQIESLQQALQNNQKVDPYPFLTEGERVRIKRGTLAGIEGILIKRDGFHRLVITIELLQRAVSLNVDTSDIELS